MNISRLTWESFDWGEFQQLCIEIAEYKFPECDFQEYLKHGNKQFGIDLRSFDYNNGTFLNIQCKRVKTLTQGQLREFVNEFISNTLSERCSHFIIATSYETNTSKLTPEIDVLKQELLENNNIQFHCWGKEQIEKYLKYNWHIVSTYFGTYAADTFCHPQTKQSYFEKLQPLANYIPRTILSLNHPKDTWIFENRETKDLISLLGENRVLTKRICLVGDAHQGKSAYIKQCAFLLKNHEIRLRPLLLEIKELNVGTIEEMLDKSFGQWKSIPLKEIALFIDGLDEAPIDKFRDIVTSIKSFADYYPAINIILSCRKLFYNQFNIDKILEKFELYELGDIKEAEIEGFIRRELREKYSAFILAANKNKVTDFFYHPFYLIGLVEEYKKSGKLPKTKMKVVELFVNNSFENTRSRRLDRGRIIEEEFFRFKKLVNDFAMALQFAEKNALSYAEVQELFGREERDILKQSPLFSSYNDSWSFTNAMFQEHLAAVQLSKLSFDKIKSHVSIGVKLTKIRLKWVQTISSLLSLLPNTSPLFKQVFKLIESDSIELLFQTERTKYDHAFKESLLVKLIEECVVKNRRTVSVREETIGDFIEGADVAVEYLVTCLGRPDISELIKDVCVRILLSTTIPKRLNDKILHISKEGIQNTSSAYFAGQLIRILAKQKIGDQNLIGWLCKLFPNEHEYRDDIYGLITSLNLHEKYYDYALEGIPILLTFNKEISHSGSERSLEELLLATKLRANLWKLVTRMQQPDWLGYYRVGFSSSDSFAKSMFNIFTGLYETDPLIVFPIAFYLKVHAKHHSLLKLKELEEFLAKTKTSSFFVELFIDEILSPSNCELATLITPVSYDYLLFEYEQGARSMDSLKNCIWNLRYIGKEQEYKALRQLSEDATEGMIIDNNDSSAYNEDVRREAQKKANDRMYIESKEHFKGGILAYFKTFGKKSGSDLLIDTNRVDYWRNATSNFITSFFDRFDRNSTLTLSACLSKLDEENFFEIFRIEELLSYKIDEEDKQFYHSILRHYYYQYLPLAIFPNCQWLTNGYIHWKTVEVRLGKIFEKFKFDTPEYVLIKMIWLDCSGIKGFAVAKDNDRKTISDLIIDTLSSQGIENLRGEVLENIKAKDIRHDGVLGNHISLCDRLFIIEAKDDILEIIDKRKNNFSLVDLFEIYLRLDGNLENVVRFISDFKEYNDYSFLSLIKLIENEYENIALGFLQQALSHLETKDEMRIGIAKKMASLGSFEGFKFLMSYMRKNFVSPYSIQSLSYDKLDISLCLTEIRNLSFLIIDKKYENKSHFSENARNVLVELLYSLAARSENDLDLVINYCEETYNELKKEGYDDVGNFKFYIDRMIENFRSSDKGSKTIPEIKSLLDGLAA